MERLDIYLDMLHDYMHTRDHYNFRTMHERNTGAGFSWYIHVNVEAFRAEIYEDFGACLPELHLIVEAYNRKNNLEELPKGCEGIKIINLRIAMIKKAIELLLKAPCSTPSGPVG